MLCFLLPSLFLVSFVLGNDNLTEPEECALANLRKVIKSVDFTVSGLYSNCTIFHLSHEMVDGSKLQGLSDAKNTENSACAGHQLDLIKKSNGDFQFVLINRLMYYLQPRTLLTKRENGEFTQKADLSSELRKIAASKGEFNNLVDVKADSNGTTAYQFGIDFDEKPKFLAVNLENNTLIPSTVSWPENIKQISAMAFDSDGRTLYFKQGDNKVKNVPIDAKGNIDFAKIVEISKIANVDTIAAMSVSNGYGIFKLRTSKGFKYYIQNFVADDNADCFAETSGNDLDMKLFVSPGLNDRIHNVIFPTTTTTTTTSSTTTTTEAPTTVGTKSTTDTGSVSSISASLALLALTIVLGTL